MSGDYRKISSAAGWSTLAEICARLTAPLAALLLARVLTPADFGAMAAVTLVVSFADMMSECGFQKYLVQRRFRSDAELRRYADTAIWTSVGIALAGWLLIALFASPLARLAGTPDAARMMAAAGIALPLSAVSGTQSALLKRWMRFKALFRMRVAAACVPLAVTVPLAIIFRSWTALLFGLLATNALNAFLASRMSYFRPAPRISRNALKDMAPFSLWSMAEALLVWLTTYLDILVVGMTLDSRHLGLYRTASLTVAQIIGVVTAAVTPVLFSALSRRQHDPAAFRDLLLRFQRKTALLLVPLCFGIFIFSDTATSLLLGDQWSEISDFIGLWALTAAPVTLISHFAAETYRASGKPRRAMLSQTLHLIAVLPAVTIAIGFGFDVLCQTRAAIRLEGVAVNLTLLQLFYSCRAKELLANLFPAFCGGAAMTAVLLFPKPQTAGATIALIMLSLALYAATLALWRSQRKEFTELLSFIPSSRRVTQ